MTLSVESTTPVSRACDRCSAQTVAGTRYEATQTVSVRLCLRCGWEFPKFGACCDMVATPLLAVDVEPRVCAYEPCTAPIALLRHTYCSREHYALDKRVRRVSVTCPCGAAFEVTEANRRLKKGVYCSTACLHRFFGATKIGVDPVEYDAQRAAGNLWCTTHRTWHPSTRFARNATHSNGFNSYCRRAAA